jgi:hypothetical protein
VEQSRKSIKVVTPHCGSQRIRRAEEQIKCAAHAQRRIANIKRDGHDDPGGSQLVHQPDKLSQTTFCIARNKIVHYASSQKYLGTVPIVDSFLEEKCADE